MAQITVARVKGNKAKHRRKAKGLEKKARRAAGQ